MGKKGVKEVEHIMHGAATSDIQKVLTTKGTIIEIISPHYDSLPRHMLSAGKNV